MSVKTASNLMFIASKIEELINQKSSVILKLTHQGKLLVNIYIYSGRLQYIVDEQHRIRRWQRLIKRTCPNWKIPEMWPENEPWEYEILALSLIHI